MKFMIKDKEIWHKWFAWYPVKIKNVWVWREKIERKLVFNCGCVLALGDFGGWNYEYRFLEKNENTNTKSAY